MKKLCVYPVRKWEDIPIETRERIKRELSVPLPPSLLSKEERSYTGISPRGNYNKPMHYLLIMGISLILTISIILLILLYI